MNKKFLIIIQILLLLISPYTPTVAVDENFEEPAEAVQSDHFIEEENIEQELSDTEKQAESSTDLLHVYKENALEAGSIQTDTQSTDNKQKDEEKGQETQALSSKTATLSAGSGGISSSTSGNTISTLSGVTITSGSQANTGIIIPSRVLSGGNDTYTGVILSGSFSNSGVQASVPPLPIENESLEERLEKVREEHEGVCKKSTVHCVELIDDTGVTITITEDDDSGEYYDETTGTLYEYDKKPESNSSPASANPNQNPTNASSTGSTLTGSVFSGGIIPGTGSVLSGGITLGTGSSLENPINNNDLSIIPGKSFVVSGKQILGLTPQGASLQNRSSVSSNSSSFSGGGKQPEVIFKGNTRIQNTHGVVTSFDAIQVLDRTSGNNLDLGSLLVGSDADHLIFSQPVEITIPTPGIQEGSEIEITTLHFGDEKYNRKGLSVDPNTGCTTEGYATLPSWYTTVKNGVITFYTCSASTFTITYVGGATFDNFVDNGSLAKTLTVPAGGLITDVNVLVDFQPIDSEDPTSYGTTNAYSNEVSMTIQSPLGTTISLLNVGTYTNNGPANRAQVTFDDSAGSAPTNLPVDGTFLPSQALSSFVGEDPIGDRTFTISDSTNQDGVILYEVSLEITDGSTCGNSTVEGAEGCDDGNTSNGDGCSDSCLIENTYACNITPPGAEDNASCLSGVCDQNEATPTCEAANSCGNGLVEVGEQCDDGNTANGDGCSSSCTILYCSNGTIDSASAFQTVFYEDFETFNGVTQTSGTEIISVGTHTVTYTNNGANGRVQYGTNAQLANGGAGALSMDANPTGTFVTNRIVFQSDLSNYTNAIDLTLTFDRTDHGDEDQSQDIVEIRGSSSDSWVPVYSFAPASQANGTYRTITVDVDDILTTNGQVPGSTFQVRFGQNDNFGITSNTATDGITLDNIGITGTSNGPIIDETCDDGNESSGDGCDSSCQTESGYTCVGEPSVCTICGNGSIEGTEQCDDGNSVAGDGCDDSCQIETDRECSGAPSSCIQCTTENSIIGTIVTNVGNTPQTITYSDFTNHTYTSTPIVLATPISDNNGNNPPIPVLTSISTTSVSLRSCVDAGNSTCDATALGEDFSVFIIDVDKASCTDHIEAGTTTITTNGADTAFTFGSGFTNTPYVFTTPQTNNQGGNIAAHAWVDDNSLTTNGGDFIGCVHQNGNAGNVDICTGGQPSEILGRVALDPILFSMTGLQLGEQGISNSNWTNISFSPAYTQPPAVMVTQNSDNGGQDPQYPWARDITPTNAQIRYCEADAGGVCNSHASEDTMWFSLDVTVCGNGSINTGETCDDGNSTAGDGCDDSCQVESGYTCVGEPSICSICGNGVIDGVEQCDDANTTPGDGCSATCQIEFCGNGTIDLVGGLSGTLIREDFETVSGTSQVSGTFITSGSTYTLTYENTGTQGRIRYGANTIQANGGVGAATFDVNPTGTFITNRLVFEIDLSAAVGSTDITLDFDRSDHGDEDQPEDIVEIRGSTSDPWITLYDWKANDIGNGTYQTVSGLDIDATLSTNGQNPSASTQIRFSQNDNFSANNTNANDGFSVDNIIIAGTLQGPTVSETCDDGNTTSGDGCDSSCQIESASNNPPTDILLSGNTLIENNSINQLIGSLTTTDLDLSDTHTYSFGCALPLSDEQYFTFSGNQLLASTGFNFEIPADQNTDNSYEICILTDDGNGGTYEESFSITVFDEYEEVCIYAGTGIVFNVIPVSSNGNIVATQTFNDWFQLEDFSGSDTGYYTTLSIGGFNGALGNFMPASIAEISVTNPISVVSGSANPNVQLDIALNSFIPFSTPITYLYRNAGSNNGVTGYYSTSPTLRLTIPEYQAVDTYTATITYTLYEN